jgi:beta-galactosidase GanA
VPVTSTLRSIFLVLSIVTCSSATGQNGQLPHLITKGFTKQLIVDGKPFLVLGGELGNSSASSNAYMKPHWKKLADMQLNTVLLPVYWELMEPAEGKFDFRLVDSMIMASRQHHLKVILLWFGSWKNSMSCYAPAWIKTDQKRFPRAQNKNGNGLEILSAFSRENLNADIKAFTALMGHLKKTDRQHTVIMIQVENEIGMLTEAREYTAPANNLFTQNVPDELMHYLILKKDSLVPELKEHWSGNGYLTKGNWETVFGKGLFTDELFQAWHYAKFTNAVAAAGKKEYPLPMFVNAALNHRDVLPGQYPSAGPLPHLMDIWQAGAPEIDMLSPDFYTPRFKHFSDLFSRRNNPFFIPEIRFEPSVEAKVFFAVGHYHALGFSPFSIESVTDGGTEPLGKSYAVLAQLSPIILRSQGTGAIDGVLLDSTNSRQTIVFGKYKITMAHDYTLGWSPEARKPGWPATGAIIIQEGADEFVIAGTGVVATFSRVDADAVSVGILQAEEGKYINNKWIAGRRMNGDQDHQGRHIRIAAGEWNIQKVKLYNYQ